MAGSKNPEFKGATAEGLAKALLRSDKRPVQTQPQPRHANARTSSKGKVTKSAASAKIRRTSS